MKHPVIREFLLGQEKQVVPFLKQATRRWSTFASGHAALEYWKWKHLDGPLGASHISLAFAEEQIVGCNHQVPLRFKFGDRFHIATYGTDLAVHPGYRRRGLYPQLYKFTEFLRRMGGSEFCYWIARKPFMARSFERDYGHLPVELAVYINITDVRLHLRMKSGKNALIKFVGYRLLHFRNKLFNLSVKKPVSTRNFSISEISRFDNNADKFCRAAAQPFSLMGERNRNFLNWRFLDPRAGKFTVKLALEKGRMIAFIATKIVRRDTGYSEGYIADILTLPGRLDASEALLCDAMGHFHRSGVNAVYCMLPTSSPYPQVLRRYGFVDSRFRERVFIDSMGNDHIKVKTIGLKAYRSHYLSYADFDLV